MNRSSIVSPLVAACFVACCFAMSCRAEETDGFQILVWQYKTDAQQDLSLYRDVNLNGFHIDRGEGKGHLAAWAATENIPYYVDHAAGKGIFHLTPRSGLETIARDGSRSSRPWSFSDPKTLEEIGRRLDANVPPVASGPVVAIALDDEVSLGTFNSPLEVDFSDASLNEFRLWLPTQYPNSATMERAWSLADGQLANPATYEEVRSQIGNLPPSRWRLAPWIDFRTFMDEQQSNAFAKAVEHTNRLAPGVPAGVVGGQQPSAYGGFDYAKLRHSLQFIESYDIGASNEILHSFWSQSPRKPRMQTYFASGDLQTDEWFLWYYLAHGCRGVIAWPDMKGKPWFEDGEVHPHIQALAPTFKAVQDKAFDVLADPQTTPIFSPIAVLYSHPSVQVGWAIDASAHGKTWPRRSSSLDNSCLSSGKNRVAWTRLLEDLGHQPRIIDTQELVDGWLQAHGFRVLVLPQCFALSERECNAIAEFVEQGGAVIADYGTAVTDEHGTGYDRSPLDRLFGIDRTSNGGATDKGNGGATDKGWFAGDRYELNGEKYNQPFAKRFGVDPLTAEGELRPVENSVSETVGVTKTGRGSAVFANASPTGYYDFAQRAGRFGDQWRRLVGNFLTANDVQPAVDYRRIDGLQYGVELLRYRVGSDREIWAFVPNPTRQAAVDGAGSGLRLPSKPVEVAIKKPRNLLQIKELKTHKTSKNTILVPPSQAVFLEVSTE